MFHLEKKALFNQLYFIIHITHKQEKLQSTQKTLFQTVFAKHSASVSSLESISRIWSWEKIDEFKRHLVVRMVRVFMSSLDFIIAVCTAPNKIQLGDCFLGQNLSLLLSIWTCYVSISLRSRFCCCLLGSFLYLILVPALPGILTVTPLYPSIVTGFIIPVVTSKGFLNIFLSPERKVIQDLCWSARSCMMHGIKLNITAVRGKNCSIHMI